MSSRFQSLRPPYPVYESQPIFGGDLPTIDEIGPPDVRASATNPYYDMYRGAHGRNFSGLGVTNMMSADRGLQDYPNELDLLAEMDDVQGNGVFDPHGSHGNIHPDEGVFADHENLPGYLVRDEYYAPSQVIDGTTGEPVMYVPGGAVAIDQSQLDTYRDRQLLWEIPPGMSAEHREAPPDGETWIPHEYSWPISGIGEEISPPGSDTASLPGQKSKVPLIASFAIIGVAVGVFVATLVKK
jgi:hypothetical protein